METSTVSERPALAVVVAMLVCFSLVGRRPEWQRFYAKKPAVAAVLAGFAAGSFVSAVNIGFLAVNPPLTFFSTMGATSFFVWLRRPVS